MKKIIKAFLLTGALAIMLSACSAGGKNDSGEAAKTAKDDNTLTVWCWDPNFNVYAMKEAEKIYQKDHPDFKLNIEDIAWNDLQNKFTTVCTAKDYKNLPDIFLMQDYAFQKNIKTFPDVFCDLDKAGINYDDFAKGKTDFSVVDGVHYGVPFDNGTVIAAYRTDLLEQAGLSVDDFKDITWDKYIELGKQVLEKTGKPLMSNTTNGDLLMIMLRSAGASLFDKDGKPYIANNEAVKVAVDTYIKLKQAGVYVEVNDWDQYVGTFTNDNVAGVINGCWILASVQSAKDQSGKWAVTNMPKFANLEGATNYSGNGGSTWAVSNKSDKKELAFDFLKNTFGSSVELYETILPSAGALSTYLPAGDSDVYKKPQEFFAGQPIYKDITDYAKLVPSTYTGLYYYEAADSLVNAIQAISNGTSVDDALKQAQESVEFLSK